MDQWQGLDEFVAIATAGSFTGGAKLLGTSTTRISRVIVQLEARIQAQLFDRTTRTVKLTDTGRAILEQCRRLLAERGVWLKNGKPKRASIADILHAARDNTLCMRCARGCAVVVGESQTETTILQWKT